MALDPWDCDMCVRVLLGALIDNGGFMGCGFTVCVCVLLSCGCWLLKRKREREREK